MEFTKFNKSRLLKLLEYSKFASVVLLSGVKTVDAEVVYTNIEPDTILSENFDAYVIDFNGDGIDDVGFWNRSFIYYVGFYSTSKYLLQRIWAMPTAGNSFAGSMSTFAGIKRYYPYALLTGDLISNSLEFQSHYAQRMAFRTFDYDWNGTSSELDLLMYGGNWYPEVTDHYLGVRFVDLLNHTHYGWIRCDVLDEGRTLIIKDYAYEVKQNTGVLAGDTVGDTTLQISEHLLEGVEVYSFNNEVFILLYEPAGLFDVQVFDAAGCVIYNSMLLNKENKIQLNVPAGVYFVRVSHDGQQFIGTVYLN